MLNFDMKIICPEHNGLKEVLDESLMLPAIITFLIRIYSKSSIFI